MFNVHFILTQGQLTPDYRRAIISARVHDKNIVLWYNPADGKPDRHGLDIQLEPWQWDGRTDIRPAHLYDVLAYQLAYEHGGLFLGLDTISIRPAWDLLTGEFTAVVSTDWPEKDWADRPHAFNNNFLSRVGSPIMFSLYAKALEIITSERDNEWGATGPYLLTPYVKAGTLGATPYPALCGWSPGYIWRFYLGLEAPSEDVRVIHLCKSAYIDLYERRYGEWAKQFPYYAGEVARRTDLNERLLREP